MGTPLKELRSFLDKYYEVIKRYRELSEIPEYEICYQAVINLNGVVEYKLLIKGDICDGDEIVSEFEQKGVLTPTGIYTLMKQIILYLYKEFEKSIAIAMKVIKCLDAMTGMNLIAEYNFYYSLSLLAHYQDTKKEEQLDYLKQVRTNQEKLKSWADHAPEDFKHKYLLVEAELSRVQGEIKSTISLFDRAIELAGQNDFIQDKAIANERAALFYHSEGMEKIARIYMQEAYNGYKRWGAAIKLTDLKNEYPYLLDESGIDEAFIAANNQFQKSLQLNSSIMLDYSSIVNSLQAFSSEIVLGNLLDRIMKIVVESSGATRGIIILVKDNNLFIEAESIVLDKELSIIKSVPLEERDRKSVV